jgi:hypothetical protein
MRRRIVLSLLVSSLALMFVNCGGDDEPYFCHLYGYIRDASTNAGVDSLTFGLMEVITGRLRYYTTMAHDTTHGYFEVDSVLYGTSSVQGSSMVAVVIDDSLSPGWLSRTYYIDVDGPVDTVYVSIMRAN